MYHDLKWVRIALCMVLWRRYAG